MLISRNLLPSVFPTHHIGTKCNSVTPPHIFCPPQKTTSPFLAIINTSTRSHPVSTASPNHKNPPFCSLILTSSGVESIFRFSYASLRSKLPFGPGSSPKVGKSSTRSRMIVGARRRPWPGLWFGSGDNVALDFDVAEASSFCCSSACFCFTCSNMSG